MGCNHTKGDPMSFVIIPSNPPIKVEMISELFLQNQFFIRGYTGNSVGGFDATANAGTNPWKAGLNDWNQLAEVLTYSGVPGMTPATAKDYLAANSKEVVMQAIAKWIREVLIPAILKMVNDLLGKQTAPAAAKFTNPTEVMDAALQGIKFTVNADGSVSASY